MSESTRSITVILRGGKKRRVSGIPSDAKITYGPVQPGRQGGYNEGNALRIYTSKENQLAVFVGVEEFRDDSLQIQEQKVVKKTKAASETGPKGSSSKVEDEVEYEWESA